MGCTNVSKCLLSKSRTSGIWEVSASGSSAPPGALIASWWPASSKNTFEALPAPSWTLAKVSGVLSEKKQRVFCQ